MKGFTLVEVLVSLLILSIVAAAGLSSISFSTKNFITLRDNFYSSTIAENILLLSYYDDNFLTNNISSQKEVMMGNSFTWKRTCLLYTSPSPRDRTRSRMPSSA